MDVYFNEERNFIIKNYYGSTATLAALSKCFDKFCHCWHIRNRFIFNRFEK